MAASLLRRRTHLGRLLVLPVPIALLETCRSRWPASQLTVAYTRTRPIPAGCERLLSSHALERLHRLPAGHRRGLLRRLAACSAWPIAADGPPGLRGAPRRRALGAAMGAPSVSCAAPFPGSHRAPRPSRLLRTSAIRSQSVAHRSASHARFPAVERSEAAICRRPPDCSDQRARQRLAAAPRDLAGRAVRGRGELL